MEELDLKNKIAIFGIGMIFLYIFVLLPLEKTLEVKNEIENYNKKIYVSSKKIKEVEKQLDEKLKEFEKLENSIINLEEKKYKFASVSEGNIYISNFLEKYILEVLEIGRIEVLDDNNYLIPYRVVGDEKNIIDFVEYIEKDNKVLLLTKNFEIKKINDSFELSLYFYIFVGNENIEINKGVRRNLSNKFIDMRKVEFINNDTGIIEIENKKFYINKEKIIEVNGIKYKIVLKNKKVFVKDGEYEK